MNDQGGGRDLVPVSTGSLAALLPTASELAPLRMPEPNLVLGKSLMRGVHLVASELGQVGKDGLAGCLLAAAESVDLPVAIVEVSDRAGPCAKSYAGIAAQHIFPDEDTIGGRVAEFLREHDRHTVVINVGSSAFLTVCAAEAVINRFAAGSGRPFRLLWVCGPHETNSTVPLNYRQSGGAAQCTVCVRRPDPRWARRMPSPEAFSTLGTKGKVIGIPVLPELMEERFFRGHRRIRDAYDQAPVAERLEFDARFIAFLNDLAEAF